MSVAGWGAFRWGRSIWGGRAMPNMVIDRTQADVAQRTVKGYYNNTDLNRVGEAVQYVADRLRTAGYAIENNPKTDWVVNDIPMQAKINRYLTDVATIRNTLVVEPMPPVPVSMSGLWWWEANDIERILLDVEDALIRISAAWYYSGDLYSGEV